MAKFEQHKKKAQGKTPAKKSNKPAFGAGFQISDKRCKVCQSDSRRTIDKLLVLGVASAAEIARQYSKVDGVRYTRQSMNNHKNKHLDLKDAAMRRVIERRAEEVGLDVEEMADHMLTARGILEAMIIKGHEGVVAGNTPILPEHLMAALKQLKEEDSDYHAAEVASLKAEFREELNAFIRSVQKIVPPAMHDDIMVEFKKTLSEIEDQRAAQIEQHTGH